MQHKSILDSVKSSPTFKGWPWEMWFHAAELTSFIDFGCSFCSSKNGSSMNMRCCEGCARRCGHLERIPEGKEHQKVILSAWDEETGFWRPGGCVLPRKYRSYICLTYCCGHALESVYTRRRNREYQEPSSYVGALYLPDSALRVVQMLHLMQRSHDGYTSWLKYESANIVQDLKNGLKDLDRQRKNLRARIRIMETRL